MLLRDKVVIISGIGPGLGQELALAAAREGARLAICARTPARLDKVESDVNDLGLGTEVLRTPTDITDAGQCRRLLDRTMQRFGQIDVLINSGYTAGGYQLAAEADLDDWRRTMETNLFGTMNMIQAAVPHLTEHGGSIVNVNTKVSRMPRETMGGYAVSKAALRMATTQLAKELGKHRIRVNSVFLGWMWGETVETGLAAAAAQRGISISQVRAEIASDIPLGDIPEDSDCAKSVIALASDHFLAVTGACLDVNGGEYLPL